MPGPIQAPSADERRKDAANTLTHGIAAVLAAILVGPLIALAVTRGDVRHVVSFSIFGGTLIFLLSASALMHWRQIHGTTHRVFELLDYTGIYLLIAGTYTPFCLVTLHGALGWTLFGVVWGLALAGTLMQALLGPRFDRYSLLLYLAMGWLVLVPIVPLTRALHGGGLALLLGGGLAYSAGVAVYLNKRIFHSHAIWHLFVGLGALLHAAAMVFYVLPDLH